MDIRTKLVFALVGTSLLSMLALGAVGYPRARELLRQTSLRQLEALAESRQRDLEAVVEAWGERVGLIGSRTTLRRTLGAYGDGPDEAGRSVIREILEDARLSAASVVSAAVYDLDRSLVAASLDPGARPPEATLPDTLARVGEGAAPRLTEVDLGQGGEGTVRWIMPLEVDGRGRVGWLAARLAADDLAGLAADTTGLGASGETLVVTGRGGRLTILHPTRHPAAAEPLGEGGVDPARIAAAGRDTVLWEGAVDYRNRRVWAATRYLPALDWGIVVKVDAAEEREPLLELRDELTRLALSLAAFAILAGVLLGLHLARPIHDLAEVADRIEAGETDVRAKIHHEDEVGMLARTFNRMADTLTRGRLSLADPEQEEDREDGTA